MNSYSFKNLRNLLKSDDRMNNDRLYDYLEKWNILKDNEITKLLTIYKEMYNNDTKVYYRNSIYKDNKYEIVLIYWCPYTHTRIHFHPKGGCIMKVLDGYLDIDIYDDSDYATIEYKSSKILNEEQIEYIEGKHGIHRISNDKNSNYAISINIYIYNK